MFQLTPSEITTICFKHIRLMPPRVLLALTLLFLFSSTVVKAHLEPLNYQPNVDCNALVATSPSGVVIAHLEISQGIETENLPYIANRSTAVLVQICMLSTSSVILSGKLSVMTNGVSVNTLNPITHLTFNGAAAIQTGTLIFEPLSLTANEQTDLHVEIFDFSNSTTVLDSITIVDLPTVSPILPQFNFVRIGLLTNQLGFPASNVVGSPYGDSFLRAAMPLDDSVNWQYHNALNGIMLISKAIDDNANGKIDLSEHNKLLDHLSQWRFMSGQPTSRGDDEETIGPTELTFLYGWLSDENDEGIVEANGASFVNPGRVGFGSTTARKGQQTYIHEVLHNIGLGHTRSLISSQGWDVHNHLPAGWNVNNLSQRKSSAYFSVMNEQHNIGTNNSWVELTQYAELQQYYSSEKLRRFVAEWPFCDGIVIGQPCILQNNVLLRGIFDENGVELIERLPAFQNRWYSQPTYTYSSITEALPFTMIFQGEDNNTIAEIPFDARIASNPDDGSDGIRFGAFEIIVPASLIENTDQVLVRNINGDDILYQTKSENVPSVEFIEPDPDSISPTSILGERITIEVSDEDTVGFEELECSFVYSPDNDDTRIPLAVGIPCTHNTQLQIDIDWQYLPNSREDNGTIEVFVSDGLNTGRSEISGLTVNTDLRVDFEQTGPRGTPSLVEDSLVFQIHASAPTVGREDGDGIDHVEMFIQDEDETVVYRTTDDAPDYCAFERSITDCAPWVFSEHDFRWPEINDQQGVPILNGTYFLTAIAHRIDGKQKAIRVPIELRVARLPERSVNLSQRYGIFTSDINDDGNTDLIWNENVDRNLVYWQLSTNNNTLGLGGKQKIPGPNLLDFQMLIGDVNGDGKDDLIWNRTGSDRNRIYVGVSNGDGTFTFGPVRDHPAGPGWATYKTLVADVNGDSKDDLVWNRTGADRNRIYVGLSNGDGTFTFGPVRDHPAGPGWADYATLVADVNGDGNDDLIWNHTHEPKNRIYVGISQTDGTFHFLPHQDSTLVNWENFQPLVVDLNGDSQMELLWSLATNRNQIYVGTFNTTIAEFEILPFQ